MSGAPVEDKVEEEKSVKRVRTAYDVQRSKLEKLMKDPSKPVFIPTPRNEKDPNKAPDFVYNVSSYLEMLILVNHALLSGLGGIYPAVPLLIRRVLT